MAKYIWIVLIAIIFLGHWFFYFVAAEIIAFLLVLWLKPEWLDK